MVIKASRGHQVEGLVADLHSDDDVRRETAIARLTVIGTRAVDRLVGVAEAITEGPLARMAAFRALEAIGDHRALGPALDAARGVDQDVACAGVNAARGFMRGPNGSVVVEELTRIAVDVARHETVRLAAMEALDELETESVQPLWYSLVADRNDAVRAYASARAAGRAAVAGPDAAGALDAALDGPLPDDAEGLRTAIVRGGAEAPLNTLHALVDRLREREGADPSSGRSAWTAARGAAHAALAGRGSRLALYDLRETIGRAASPLPPDFLTAIESVGDASCLEALAGAFLQAGGASSGERDRWRAQLAGAFRAIVTREQLTRRHGALRRLEKRWPGVLDGLDRGRP